MLATHAPTWAHGNRTYRGTRLLVAAALVWSGAILLSFGALAVPAAHDIGHGGRDQGLLGLLGAAAPWLVGLGLAGLVAAWGAARDRSWWIGLSTWVVAAGAFVIVGAMVLALAGRDPLAVVSPGGVPAGEGIGVFAWTLALLGVAGWGLRRVAAARAAGRRPVTGTASAPAPVGALSPA